MNFLVRKPCHVLLHYVNMLILCIIKYFQIGKMSLFWTFVSFLDKIRKFGKATIPEPRLIPGAFQRHKLPWVPVKCPLHQDGFLQPNGRQELSLPVR